MSLEMSGKEHRKPYHGSKAFDRTCRNHGACLSNRMHKYRKREPLSRPTTEEALFYGQSDNH
jgi:hypothetical protein